MLKKVSLKPGVNRENTRYTTEGGWYESEKVRFRQGNPEKIGGWERISADTFLGVCRSLWNWVTLEGQDLLGVGTNLKFYIERGGAYYDITPVRSTVTLNNPFDTTIGLATVTVTDVAHGCLTGDYVTFSGASTVGGLTLNNEYEVTVVDADTYTITASSTASSTVTGGGGASVSAAYQINTGAAIQVPFTGWGAGGFGLGTWGFSGTTLNPVRLWAQSNFGEDLVFSYRGGSLFYWDATGDVTTRGIYVTAMPGASDVPTVVNFSTVSDINRFVFAFGCNEAGSSTLDPMLIRWSDQEDITMWTPSATNQAGSLRVSHGSEIVTAVQARQEVLVWTDTSLYSLQYLGAPEVWGAQILGDSMSIVGQNAAVYVASTAFWMGRDKFYMYDGTVRPLASDLRRYVFSDINTFQYDQVFAAANEAFHEVWWFYCSAGSDTVDRYVVYNYLENLWYYGTMARTAWVDGAIRNYPVAATYTYNLVEHEKGTDDKETATTLPIEAYITSSEFDIEDGDHFVLVNRILPDVTFEGSTADSPAISMTLSPMTNSGSGYSNPLSEGGNSTNTITRSTTVPIEQFTGQVFVRIRGRQLVMKVASTALGVAWQLGSPRLDMRPDGRRGI